MFRPSNRKCRARKGTQTERLGYSSCDRALILVRSICCGKSLNISIEMIKSLINIFYNKGNLNSLFLVVSHASLSVSPLIHASKNTFPHQSIYSWSLFLTFLSRQGLLFSMASPECVSSQLGLRSPFHLYSALLLLRVCHFFLSDLFLTASAASLLSAAEEV